MAVWHEFVFHIFSCVRNMMFSDFGFEFIMIQIAVTGQYVMICLASTHDLITRRLKLFVVVATKTKDTIKTLSLHACY